MVQQGIKMKLKIGRCASYIQIKDTLVKPLTTKELGDNIYIDYDSDGEVYGIELIGSVEVEDK